MSLHTGQANMRKASKDLAARWGEVRALWRDEVARQFEEQYIHSLLREVRVTQEAMAHMGSVVVQIRQDCE
ncbi:MAG: hypothetical protein QUV05_01925 [Phycisphaerae bacterium]|jgi:hypothetical protein|nr:hypothetical protein [Phycisphaerae bacterium]